MPKIDKDKYYTEDSVAQYCVEKTFEILGADWDRIIEPSAGEGAFLKFLPKNTIAYDIEPENDGIIQTDYREVKLPYMEKSLVIGNPPFGRANKLSVQFVKVSLTHSPYIAIIQPISQLNQNRTMKDTELLYSEDLGVLTYSGKKVHCCFNIYHFCKNGHKQNYEIPGIKCRHIFRSGKSQHSDDILNYPWDFRVSAWGSIHLLDESEFCPNEIVFKVNDDMKEWVRQKLEECNYQNLLSCVSTPNLPIWRLKKWLYNEWYNNTHI